MPGSYLLDTSIVIPYRAGEPAVVELVRQADEVFLPVVVVGELLYGTLKSPLPEQNRRWVEELTARIPVLGCDRETAETYADVRNELRLAGLPIPENDLWIAAIARQHGLSLAARDKHFLGIRDLTVVAP
jgi:tRNA(fMet)-specific endonuclease VapC